LYKNYKKPQDILRILQKITLFKGLSSEQLQRTVEVASRRDYSADSTLFYQGDEATKFYLLLDGEIKLSQLTEDGQQIILHIVVSGEAFGILAVLQQIPYPVTAQAVKPAQVLAWDEQTMRELMAENVQLAFNALGILAGHIHEYQDRFREIATEKVERRIARTLLRLGNSIGKKTESGVLIDIPLTRQDIGEMTGSTLFTVSRILRAWEEKGYVKSQRERVTLRQPHELVKITEEIQ
jgi:CRP-like cAMP-binding protein